jgi:hypothetical protein
MSPSCGVLDVCFPLGLIVVRFLSYFGAVVTSVRVRYVLGAVLITMQLLANAVRPSSFTPLLQFMLSYCAKDRGVATGDVITGSLRNIPIGKQRRLNSPCCDNLAEASKRHCRGRGTNNRK